MDVCEDALGALRLGVEHFTLTCPWATEFFLVIAETELLAALKDVKRSPKLRTSVVQLDTHNPEATLETCHVDVEQMLELGGGPVMCRRKLRAAYDALMPTLRERGINFVCTNRAAFAFPLSCVTVGRRALTLRSDEPLVGEDDAFDTLRDLNGRTTLPGVLYSGHIFMI